MFNFMRLPPLRRLMLMKAITGGGSWSTVTGNPVSFTAKAAPLKQLKVAFSPKQDLHGYDSPWPAGGGANKWDEEWETGWIGWAGQNAPSDNQIRSKGFIPVVAGETYRVVSSINIQVFYYDANKDFISYHESSLPSQSTFTIPSGCAYIRFYTYYSSYGGTYKNDIAINYPSSVTTYSPYSNICPILGWDSLTVYHSGADTSDPQTISITLGSTVYSGTVDVVTGVVTVTMAKITKKWSEFANKTVGATYAEGRVYLSNLDSTKRTSSICDCLKYSNNGADYGKCFYVPSSGDYFRAIVMNTVSDDDEFTFVYPLATPLTIQLTPQEVESLAGDNTMWTDGDSLTVEYRSN